MYLVVSCWEALPGKAEEFEREARPVREALRKQPGVLMVEGFKSGGTFVVVHGYKDEATYRAVVDDPNGAFARAIAEHRLEELGRWIGSERGETIP